MARLANNRAREGPYCSRKYQVWLQNERGLLVLFPGSSPVEAPIAPGGALSTRFASCSAAVLCFSRNSCSRLRVTARVRTTATSESRLTQHATRAPAGRGPPLLGLRDRASSERPRRAGSRRAHDRGVPQNRVRHRCVLAPPPSTGCPVRNPSLIRPLAPQGLPGPTPLRRGCPDRAPRDAALRGDVAKCAAGVRGVLVLRLSRPYMRSRLRRFRANPFPAAPPRRRPSHAPRNDSRRFSAVGADWDPGLRRRRRGGRQRQRHRREHRRRRRRLFL